MNTKFVLLTTVVFRHSRRCNLRDLSPSPYHSVNFRMSTTYIRKSSLKSVSELYMHLCLQFSGYMTLL